MVGELSSQDESRLFGIRSFRHYWLARIGSMSAYQMQTVATGWTVYDLTGNPLDLGIVGLVQFLPRVLLTLWAGMVADRYDRRTIAFLCTGIQLVACGLLAWWSSRGELDRVAVFVCVALIGAARAFEMPTMQSLLPSLIPDRLFSKAIAMSTAATQLAIIGGPALAGLIFIMGVTSVYVVAMLLFAVASVLMFTMPRIMPVRKEGMSLENRSIWAGIQFIFANPVILGAVSLDLFAVLLGGATAMLPIFAKDILHAGPTGLGLLQAAPALGALAMTLYLARHPIRGQTGRILFGSVAIFGVGTIVFALSSWFWLSLSALLILGAADCISVVIRQGLVQLETPDAMRGRVSAVNSVFIGASNQLGEFESGCLAAWIGVVPSVVVGGVGTLGIVLLWIPLFPKLWNRATMHSSNKQDE